MEGANDEAGNGSIVLSADIAKDELTMAVVISPSAQQLGRKVVGARHCSYRCKEVAVELQLAGAVQETVVCVKDTGENREGKVLSNSPRQIPAIDPAKVHLHIQAIDRHYPQPLIDSAPLREPIRPLAPYRANGRLPRLQSRTTHPARLPQLQHIHQLGNFSHPIRPKNAFCYKMFDAQRLRFLPQAQKRRA